MTNHHHAVLRFVLAAGCALSPLAALAGRPLTVDDANVNEVGHGELEAWAARAGGSTTYNLAPVYAPIAGFELGVLLVREAGKPLALGELQAKWRITPSKTNGCNTAATLALARPSDAPTTVTLNGLLTCNGDKLGSVHVNLGVSKPRQGSAALTWGIAYERQVLHVTPHVEWFRDDGSKPALQVGLRGDIARDIQLDGSVGRRNGATFYTVGTKFQF